MNLNLNSNTSGHTKVNNNDLSTDNHISKKNSHKKTNSKMFEKIFEAMSPEQKSNITKKNKGNAIHTEAQSIEAKDLDKKTEVQSTRAKDLGENLSKNNADNDGNFVKSENNTLETTIENKVESTFSNLKSEVQSKPTPYVKDENFIAVSNTDSLSSFEKNKGNDNSLDNLINEIKLAKAESNQILVGTSSVDSNWTVTDLKTDKMKLSDWVEAFKSDIQKLNAFKVENQNKVSLTIKNDSDLIRVVVEKKDNSIVITANSTEESKEKLSYILSEVQSEMADKNVEIIVNIEDENQEESFNKDEQEQDNEQQGDSEKQRENDNDSNKRNKQ